MMSLVKIACARTGAPFRDHFVDVAGYVELAAELVDGALP